jgi:heterodisulfide reductase subunit B
MSSACPLCEYNVGKRQNEVLEMNKELKPIPTFYFTQLLAAALGVDAGICRFDLNGPGAKECLESKGILASV